MAASSIKRDHPENDFTDSSTFLLEKKGKKKEKKKRQGRVIFVVDFASMDVGIRKYEEHLIFVVINWILFFKKKKKEKKIREKKNNGTTDREKEEKQV